MSTREDPDRLVLMQGTLDVLILRTLIFGPEHGQGIARAIQQSSDDELLVEHGALYPALQRLEAQKLIAAKWGTSANNRRARYYTLTTKGRAQLARQSSGAASRRRWPGCSARKRRTADVMAPAHRRGLFGRSA
jgi:PadR family transcriptional regulator, regulatory protein PadR